MPPDPPRQPVRPPQARPAPPAGGRAAQAGAAAGAAAAAPPFAVQKSTDGFVVELKPNSLVQRAELERVCEGMDRLIDAGPSPQIVIDFVQVQHLSSVFLGKLIAFNKKIKGRGGTLTLTNVSPRITEVFKLTKLDTQIAIRAGSPGGGAVAPRRLSWLALLGVAAASGVAGVIASVWAATKGLPGSGARVAAMYLAVSILFAPALLLSRGWWARRPASVQWAASGVILALAAVMAVLLAAAR